MNDLTGAPKAVNLFKNNSKMNFIEILDSLHKKDQEDKGRRVVITEGNTDLTNGKKGFVRIECDPADVRRVMKGETMVYLLFVEREAYNEEVDKIE